MSITADGNRLQTIRYSVEKETEWNKFVSESRNGTFLLMRRYMEYHSNRFHDFSLIFYKKGEIVAMLPAHISDNTLYSHNGLTYGGLILSHSTTTETVMEIFRTMRDYLHRHTDVTRLVYRPTPHIYHRYPCEEDLYALFRFNAALTERKISSTVWQRHPLPPSRLRQRKTKKAAKAGYSVTECNEYTAFWEILTRNLAERHNTSPVHTLEEITALHDNFPRNIRLFCVSTPAGNIVAGTLLYITERTVHVQYIASTAEGREHGALDMLFTHLMQKQFPETEFFDFGTSVENGGRYLNSGLIFQKEGMGGRAIVYDTYTLELNEITDD